MKFSYNYLQGLLKTKLTATELRDLIELHITEVDKFEVVTGFPGIVVGEIKSIAPHPNADKLQITRTDTGDQIRIIVCGARNIAVGQKVPVALPGAHLPNGFDITVATIRGVESFGMLCSSDELGVKKPSDGILILDKKTKVGSSFGETQGKSSDTTYELKILSNRPDYMSYLAVSREIAAVLKTKLPVVSPQTKLKESTTKTSSLLKVAVADPTLAPRYMARVVKGVQVGPSPQWLQDFLQAHSLRPINNLVDISSYVMLQTGQPLHIFDYDQVSAKQISVRTATSKDKFTGLDGIERKLPTSALVIADNNQVLALAGIIGGESSAVTDSTTSIIIESANFYAANIRNTSKLVGLRTEASARFERGLDPYLAETALNWTAALVAELNPKAQVLKGATDVFASKGLLPHRTIKIDATKLQYFMDVPIKTPEIIRILNGLGLPAASTGKTISVVIPSGRRDIEGLADIAEEVLRIYGLDKINGKLPGSLPMAGGTMPVEFPKIAALKNLLTRIGYQEVYTHPFDNGKATDAVKILNPLTTEWTHLKTGLLTALFGLELTGDPLMIFEVGKVFADKGEKQLPDQPTHLAIRYQGNSAYRKLRGVLETIIKNFGAIGLELKPQSANQGLDLWAGSRRIGEIIARTDTDAGIELDVTELVVSSALSAVKTFKEPWRYPSVKFDIAIGVETKHRVGDIVALLSEIDPLVYSVELFDIFPITGKPEHSLAFHIELKSKEGTLTKTDRDEIVSRLEAALKTRFAAQIR